MSDNSQGSQSKTVVLVSSVFLALLSMVCAYLMFLGPNPSSVFWPLRQSFIFYPALGIGVLLFGRIAIIGIRKWKALQKP
jgi:uncharacterized membrane protein YbhN (UPF0104 family)